MGMCKTTLRIDGMACAMCEAHVCETIRKAVPNAKKTIASHRKGEASFLTDVPADESALKKAFESTGYVCLSVQTEPYEVRGLFRKR